MNFPGVDGQQIEDIISLTPMQAGMLFHYLKEPAGEQYVEQLSLTLQGRVDLSLFRSAWDFVSGNNEMLRTLFRWEKVKEPVQIVLKNHSLRPVSRDLSGFSGSERFRRLETLKTRERRNHVHLDAVPFRVVICRLGENSHEMILSYHHILFDGWSLAVILAEFFRVYEDLSLAREPEKPGKPRYKEFVRWLQGCDETAQERFWRPYLAGLSVPQKFSFIRRSAGRTGGVGSRRVVIPSTMQARLTGFLERTNVTLASFMYGAWALLLQKFHDCRDVVLGTTVSGRSTEIGGIEGMVGLFINTLPLRVRTGNDFRVEDLLVEIREIRQEMTAFEHTPLARIKEWAGLDSGAELFDSLVVIENYPLRLIPRRRGGLLEVQSYSMFELTHYDLTVIVSLLEAIQVEIIYRRGEVSSRAAEQLSVLLKAIIGGMLQDPRQRISQVDVLSPEDREKILYVFNNTGDRYPRQLSIHQLLEVQAERTGCRTAVVSEGRHVTYREIDRRAGLLAAALRRQGGGSGTITAVQLERSLEMVTGILGILKGGGIYLPVEPGCPAERLRYMLGDSGARLLITTGGVKDETGLGIEIVKGTAPHPQPETDGCLRWPATALAYIIYTSGTTGRPKGVPVPHSSVVNLLTALQTGYPIGSGDSWLLKTSFMFDVSVTELFGWFPGGGRLDILPPGGERDPLVILDRIEKSGITHINYVPSMFNAFVDFLYERDVNRLSSLKYIFLAGEALLPELVGKFRRLGAAVILENIYGPTEAAVYASRYSLEDWHGDDHIPIGRPLPNVKMYVLDQYDHLQCIGIAGELCIGGSGLAPGYLNRPELTAKKFVDIRYEKGGSDSSVMYRTGDLARWLPDGNIEFLGRIDQQVKIRGFRIEPAEIENRLLHREDIGEAVVTVRLDETGDPYLCAYVAPRISPGVGRAELNADELKDFLARWLPGYMIPACFVQISRLPLTAGGKLDRRSLPEPPETGASLRAVPAIPADSLEGKLVRIWTGVLGIDSRRIGPDMNFFDLGGHSLKAILLVSRVWKEFRVRLPLGRVFHNLTIERLARLIKSMKRQSLVQPKPVENREYYPLSSAQTRLYMIQQMNRHSTAYNISGLLKITGKIDAKRLENCFRILVNRHESLRTSFEIIDGEVFQRVHQGVEFKIGLGGDSPAWEAGIEAFVRPFDLTQVPLLRVKLIGAGEDSHILAVDMHHIVVDGTSLNILTREFLRLYTGDELPGISLQYKDFSAWRSGGQTDEELKETERFWLQRFSGDIPALHLPYDRSRPPVQRFEGDSVFWESRTEDIRRLTTRSASVQTTPFVMLLAVYKLLLWKLSGQEDIVVGTVVEGRGHHNLRHTVGMFVNTLPLRSRIIPDRSFIEFLKGIKALTLEAFENQDYQYESLVDRLVVQRDLSRNPLFDVAMVQEDEFIPGTDIPGLDIARPDYPDRISKFDLTLRLVRKQAGLAFYFRYCTALFQRESVVRFSRYFQNILAAVLEDPLLNLAELEVMSERERQAILRDFNDTDTPFPWEKTVARLLEEQVEKSVAAVALVDEHLQLSYGELNGRANRLAGTIRGGGVGAGSLVALLEERSSPMIIGMLGILKAGGAYLPVSPRQPRERRIFLLRDSGVEVMLVGRVAASHLPGPIARRVRLIMIDESRTTGELPGNLSPVNDASSPAYLLYTSGTTGRPRGVLTLQRSVVNVVSWFAREYRLQAGDQVLQMSDYTFDASVNQIFGSLGFGATLHLTAEQRLTDIPALARYMESRHIHVIYFVPGFIHELLGGNIEFKSLRTVICGAERLDQSVKDSILKKGYSVYNQYGPTEATIDALAGECGKGKVTLGRPIANVNCFILDRRYHLQPVGISGELGVAGEGLASGYLNNPTATAEKFIPHPFENGSRLYLTGDLARWLPDGEIEFLGRIDHQVKIRGFRVEPREIESLLLKHPGVKEAVVAASRENNGDTCLTAYVVSCRAPSSPPEDPGLVSELHRYLEERLPVYMVPAHLMRLDHLPLTVGGKVDRRALPPPSQPDALHRYRPPRNQDEARLENMWSELLGIDKMKIGIEADFFRLGGHSLKAAGLISRIHRQFNVRLPLAALFQAPTISGISDYIRATSSSRYTPILRTEKREYYRLSPAQRRLYILQQVDEDDVSYNIPALLELKGKVDRLRLQETFQNLVDRHEILRTSFRMVKGEPVQRIHPRLNIEIRDEFKRMPDFVRPFDLSRPPLLRLGLIHLSGQVSGIEKSMLMMDMHHIVADGISVALLTEEFATLYEGRELPALKIQYRDYAEWWSRNREGENLKQQEVYWLSRFHREVELLELPVDHVDGADGDQVGNSTDFVLTPEQTAALNQLALKHSMTLFMLLLTIYAVFLSRISGQEDIVIGTPIAGRRHSDLDRLVGVFINTLPIRIRVAPEDSVENLLKTVREDTLQAFENQAYPFEELVEKVVTDRVPERHPLFDVMLVLQNMEQRPFEIPGLTVSLHPYTDRSPKFLLTLTCRELESGLSCSFQFSSKRFQSATIQRFITYFNNVTAAVLADLDQRVSDIDILSETEKYRLFRHFNDTDTAYPENRTLLCLFNRQARRNPEHTAVVMNRHALTYQGVNRQAIRLARLLKARGVGNGDIVALLMEPAVEMICAVLSAWNAGAAYLPVDSEYPEDRIRFMLADSGVRLLVSDRPVDLLNREHIILPPDQPVEETVHFAGPPEPLSCLNALSLAYVIYTSGTTGRSKGVMLQHGNLVNYFSWFSRAVELSPRDKTILTSSFGFDLGYTTVYSALLNGAELHLVSRPVYLSAESLLEYIGRHGISYIKMTPSLFSALVESSYFSTERLKTLRWVVLGGEAIKTADVELSQRLCGWLRFMNHYGPTETTIGSVAQSIDFNDYDGYKRRPAIGRPIDNTQVLIVDRYLMAVPQGTAGEICLGGAGVGRGYLNRPELTAEKFVSRSPSDCLIRKSGSHLLYRTGDLGRWTADGTIEFLGRIDHQVKIRGYRIELGEIENRLLDHERIQAAAVIAGRDPGGDRYLAAYAVADADDRGNRPEGVTLREYLGRVLPDYMIPSYFVFLDELPLTPNGKLDRRALPQPAFGFEKTAPPRHEIDEIQVRIWSELLAIETGRIGIDQNFFEMGGHSLKGVNLLSRLHRAFSVKVPLARLFRTPTIRGLSDYIDSTGHRHRERHIPITAFEDKEYYSLSSAQKRIYVMQQLDETTVSYNMPVFFEVEGRFEEERLRECFLQLIRRHQSLRTCFIIVAGSPVQWVREAVTFKVEYYEMTDIKAAAKTFVRPFDLATAPLLRVGLAGSAQKRDRLMVDMHHIIADGTSRGVLVKEFMALYNGRRLPANRLRYRDYAQWQSREHRPGSRAWQREADFWKREFADQVPFLNLPYDSPRPPKPSFKGAALDFTIEPAEWEKLKNLAVSRGGTLYQLVLALFYVWLSKLSGQEDIVVGTVTEGRRHADLETVVGMFVNTLALRNAPVGDKSFTGFLTEVRAKTLAGFENQDYQFDELVEALPQYRKSTGNPLFDVMLVLETMEIPELEIPGLKLKPSPCETGTAKFDLLLVGAEERGVLRFILEYSTDLFIEKTVLRFIRFFRQVLKAVVAEPNIRLSDIEILSPEEKQQALHDLNATFSPYPMNKSVHVLFRERAAAYPRSAAVVFAAHWITYGELNRRADCLAAYLGRIGVGDDSIVGIMGYRCLETIIGLLSILKAGGAYLPIDPDYPAERIGYLAADSGAGVILTVRPDEPPSSLSERGAPVMVGMHVSDRMTRESPYYPSRESNRGRDAEPGRRLAYVIYTSGTTGWPKGVLVMHRNVVRLVKNTDYLEFEPASRILQTGALEFDASTFEIWGALLNGLTLCLASIENIMTPERLKKVLRKYDIMTIWLTSSLFNQTLEEDIDLFDGLKNLMVGGEALSPVHINRLLRRFPGLNVINGYGPTENTTFSTTLRIEEEYVTNVPIGKPIARSTAFIVDRYGKMQPPGIPGELWVGGHGLCRGYLNSPELTAEKFSQVPKVGRLYRTGDQCRRLTDGAIEFLGRIDQQVKLRGFRIEPAEIEQQLIQHDRVKEAVVVIRQTPGGDKSLTAYVVMTPGGVDLKSFLAGKLPDYMIPAFFVSMEKLPLTPNGKVDRRALPEPLSLTPQAFTLPRDEFECKVIEIWGEILGLKRTSIGVDSDFFGLGGHSLKATVLANRLHREFHVRVPLVEIFRQSTVRELSAWISGRDRREYSPIRCVEKRDYYPLSSAQRRLYVLQQMDGTGIAYNITESLVLSGHPDRNGLLGAFQRLIHRHEMLRTSFLEISGEPVQRIHDEVDFQIEYNGPAARSRTGHSPSALSTEAVIDRFKRPFDLNRPPLLRLGLIQLESHRCLLLLDIHHIIADGVSMKVMQQDWFSLYHKSVLPGLRIQYRDYSCWQHQQGREESLKQQENFWLKMFADEIPVLSLPTDHVRPTVRCFEGGAVDFEAAERVTSSLIQLAESHGATLYMVLLAAFAVLLARWSGQEDIVVGSPVAGRRHADLDQLVGMLVNTLALRLYPVGEKTFGQFLQELKGQTVAALDNQDYSFENLVDRLSPSRDTGRNPIFDVMFVLQNQEEQSDKDTRLLSSTDFTLQSYRREKITAKFDLLLAAMEEEGKLHFSVEYASSLFKRQTVERCVNSFKEILSTVSGNVEAKLGGIEVLSSVERNRILNELNNTVAEYPKDQTIHDFFQQGVQRIPRKTAVVSGDRQLTYDALNDSANQVAGFLERVLTGAEEIVAINTERSLNMVVGVLGILKAGAAYLPLDPEYPEARIRCILSDSGTRIVLSGHPSSRLNRLSQDFRFFGVDQILEEAASLSVHYTGNNPGHAAYVIYTSGSTGRPKGVMVQHGSVVNLLWAMMQAYRISPDDIFLLKTACVFDVSVTELFGWFMAAARLAVLGRGEEMDAVKIVETIDKCGVTLINFVPSMFSVFSETLLSHPIARLTGLRYIFLAGEELGSSIVNEFRRLNSGIKLENIYGPTEAAVYASAYAVDDRQETAVIPIGKPLANIRLYILDRYDRLQGVGIPGELCIAGDGLARGYLNNPELSEEKFVHLAENKLCPFPERIYRTGDRCRRLPDGNIEFLGRIDHQVKIRGFRIELAEIEQQLLRHDHVREAVVVVQQTSGSDKNLAAYVVMSSGDHDMKSYLRQKLPAHMIPASFVFLEKLPLTSSGKVDRKALPEPRMAARQEYAAPENQLEQSLVEIWRHLLKIEKIGIHDNFFDIGGHSLMIQRLIHLVRKRYNKKIRFQDVFRYPTVADLASLLADSETFDQPKIEKLPVRDYYDASYAQKRLWFLYKVDPHNAGFNLYGRLILNEKVDRDNVATIFDILVRRHESLRTCFREMDGEPVQVIFPFIDINVDIVDLSGLNPKERAVERERRFEEEKEKLFCLEEAPLFRVRLIKCASRKFDLIIAMHHIITDGWSMEILQEEFFFLFEAWRDGQKYDLPPLEIQYKEFAAWHNRLLLDEEGMGGARDFWKRQLMDGDGLPVLNLPYLVDRQQLAGFDSSGYRTVILPEITERLRSIAALNRASLFMVLLTGLKVFLSRITGQRDVIVGVPAAARQHEDLKNVIGFFVNTLILRSRINTGESFSALLQRIQENTVKVLEYQTYPLELICRELKIQYPRINVFFNMSIFGDRLRRHLNDLRSYHLEKVQNAKFDLVYYLTEYENAVEISIHYYRELFESTMIESMMKMYKKILRNAAEDSERVVGGYSISTEGRKIAMCAVN